jgi:hypothetical protein
MNIRYLAGAAAVCVLAAAPAQAAPVKVNVRVEGEKKTLFEGDVTTDVHQVTGDSTGPHKCDGTNGGANATPGPTLTGAFDDALDPTPLTWEGSWSDQFEDFLINRVGSDSATSSQFWGTALNFRDTDLGGCQVQVEGGDQVLVAFDSFGKRKLKLTGPKRVDVGEVFRVKVIDGATGDPVKRATVLHSQTSGKGRANLRINNPGLYVLKASAAKSVRSNRIRVRVK